MTAATRTSRPLQIIHGTPIRGARTLGRAKAQAIVWNVDDEQTDLLLATLNRLAGRDQLDRKLAILRRLRDRRPLRELAKLLPQTRGQLERLTAGQPTAARSRSRTYAFATPMASSSTTSSSDHRACLTAWSTIARTHGGRPARRGR